MNAKTLFREGVLALRERKDTARARALLTQSLRAEPNNEMAWLWLARTYADKDKQLQCVERALRLNPANEQALAFKQHLLPDASRDSSVPNEQPFALVRESTSPFTTEPLDAADHRSVTITGQPISMFEEAPEPLEPSAPVTMQTPLTTVEEKQVAALLAKAKQLTAADDMEGAIEQWVHVLDIRVDHPEAIQNAARALAKLKYLDDVQTLLTNAIEAGTDQPAIYMSAIDMARHKHDFGEMESLMEQVAKLPATADEAVAKIVTHFMDEQPLRATELLKEVLEQRPDNAYLLMLMGDFLRAVEQKTEAARYYERATRAKSGKVGRRADRAIRDFTPVITDRERGSVGLALREAAGFSAVYLLMGWQDAGLNLLNMGASRWLGVGLAFVGGYLVLTATSSPQQTPIAAWLGGKVPLTPPTPEKRKALYEEEILPPGPVQEPTNLPILHPALRVLFAVVGALILIGAFMLVFSVALQLLRNPVPPEIPSLQELFSELEGF